MRLVIQRVKEASVSVNGQNVGQIARGLLVFLGVAQEDNEASADYLIKKITQLRIFDDAEGKMNIAVNESGASYLVVSQFTLYANCTHGRRPSFEEAADPLKAESLYNYFVTQLKATGAVIETGIFRASMDVSLINEGPLTFILDSPR